MVKCELKLFHVATKKIHYWKLKVKALQRKIENNKRVEEITLPKLPSYEVDTYKKVNFTKRRMFQKKHKNLSKKIRVGKIFIYILEEIRNNGEDAGLKLLKDLSNDKIKFNDLVEFVVFDNFDAIKSNKVINKLYFNLKQISRG